ncbi:MAG: hypothetical protein KKH01_04450 [Firmicutes bacterium]|nr:hypothetical protein [Bacillota bacterium]
MIDIHSHILPGVDDGSQSIELSLEMIKKEMADGVTTVFFTPHVQSRVTKASSKYHPPLFNYVKEEVKKLNLDIQLFLGSEIFYRSHIETDFQALSLGGSKYILLEFSPTTETPIEEIVYEISTMGFIPIVAHVERYEYLKFQDYYKIKKTGALLQMNTTSVLGLDNKKLKKGIVSKLLNNQLIDFISTDTHNMGLRLPNMKDAYEHLKKSHDQKYLDAIFNDNAKKIIDSIEHIK